MPRYVLLEFESNEHAEKFVMKTLDKEGAGSRYRVLGFFAKPRGFCQCGHLSDARQAKEVRRGAKYGWMIHIPCGRPRRQAGHSPRNLIDPEGTPITKTQSFLQIVGSWHSSGGDTILPNYPISVKTREDDK